MKQIQDYIDKVPDVWRADKIQTNKLEFQEMIC